MSIGYQLQWSEKNAGRQVSALCAKGYHEGSGSKHPCHRRRGKNWEGVCECACHEVANQK